MFSFRVIIPFMKTKVIKVNPMNFTENELKQAADILRDGGLVAFPTETVYGLGGDGLKSGVSRKIYRAKGRPSDNPLILHIADFDSLFVIAEGVSYQAKKLAEAFWPGPLTMIFQKTEAAPYETTGGLDTVAVRMPNHPIAQALIRSSGVTIAAPSANLSGRPSPTRAAHVIDDLDGRVDMIIDGGDVGIGLESTIVDMTGRTPVILRPGYITRQMIEAVAGEVEVDPAVLARQADSELKPKAPGMKYKHYAPKADLIIWEGSAENVISGINRATKEQEAKGRRIGIIATEESQSRYAGANALVLSAGTREDEETIAHNLFRILREFDDRSVDVIYSESFASDSLGQAIMNRLLKAAGYQVADADKAKEGKQPL